ncbi:MAG: hypothetical protein C0622_13030 [Desulfuromonas sp.]|nr:MAG: hypothetical protein C0622_13030 [Desulfuromonas sp.]
MMTTDVLEEAIRRVKGLSLCRFARVWGEFHTGGTFLLIVVETNVVSPTEIELTLREPIRMVLTPLVPENPERERGSWMVVFKSNDGVFDSVMPE